MNKNKSDHESCLVIQNQLFLNEDSLAQYLNCEAVGGVKFVNCNFEKVDFPLRGSVFGSCSFQNCAFTNFIARKVQFSSCRFENCKIINSDMTRAEFTNVFFKNCEFLNVDLAGSEFNNCKFKGTRFFKSNLNSIIVLYVKVWKSKEWVEIENFSSFEIDLDELVERSYKIVFLVTLVTSLFLLVNFI